MFCCCNKCDKCTLLPSIISAIIVQYELIKSVFISQNEQNGVVIIVFFMHMFINECDFNFETGYR